MDIEMYSNISSILDDCFKDSWFLDSGSLLGVVREKKFLSSDKGIDISVIIDDYRNPIIGVAVKEMENLGFITSKFDWSGVIYKYCFVPSRNSSFEYSIDFHLFKKQDDSFLCPQVSLVNLNAIESVTTRCKKGNPMYTPSYSAIKKLILYTFELIYRETFHYFKSPIKMRDYSLRKKGLVYFWIIPCSFNLGVTKNNIYGLNMLAYPDEYLRYRYCDWKIPVSDWNTIRDDGGIRKASVEEVDRFMLK